MSYTCQNCGHQYNIDVTIHNEMWRLIKPESADKDGGMLCGSCIMAKLEPLLGPFAFKLGIVGIKPRKVWDRRQERQKIKKWQSEMRKKTGLPPNR